MMKNRMMVLAVQLYVTWVAEMYSIRWQEQIYLQVDHRTTLRISRLVNTYETTQNLQEKAWISQILDFLNLIKALCKSNLNKGRERLCCWEQRGP
ncbi:MAG: hypothetical protein CMG84_12205 [Marinobacter sp.]|nr:hypothetical protein [Marinobacter sp.]